MFVGFLQWIAVRAFGRSADSGQVAKGCFEEVGVVVSVRQLVQRSLDGRYTGRIAELGQRQRRLRLDPLAGLVLNRPGAFDDSHERGNGPAIADRA